MGSWFWGVFFLIFQNIFPKFLEYFSESIFYFSNFFLFSIFLVFFQKKSYFSEFFRKPHLESIFPNFFCPKKSWDPGSQDLTFSDYACEVLKALTHKNSSATIWVECSISLNWIWSWKSLRFSFKNIWYQKIFVTLSAEGKLNY